MARNQFDHCKNINDLHTWAESLMSPENLHCDGEVTPAYAEQRAQVIIHDYHARKAEILLGR